MVEKFLAQTEDKLQTTEAEIRKDMEQMVQSVQDLLRSARIKELIRGPGYSESSNHNASSPSSVGTTSTSYSYTNAYVQSYSNPSVYMQK